MAAKQSQEMRDALKLVAAGMPIRQAARSAGVHWTSLHVALKKLLELDNANA